MKALLTTEPFQSNARKAGTYRGAKRNAARAVGLRYGTPRSTTPALPMAIEHYLREQALVKFWAGSGKGARSHRIGPGRGSVDTMFRDLAKKAVARDSKTRLGSVRTRWRIRQMLQAIWAAARTKK